MTITDDDTAPGKVVLSVSPSEVSEDAADAATITVTGTLEGAVALATATAVTVAVGGGTATEGTDYATVGDFTLTIPARSATGTATFSLHPTDDNVAEGTETVAVTGTTTGLTVDAASVTITDDDAVAVSVAAASAAEGEAVEFTVSLSGAAASAVTVAWKTADATATGGTDYTAVSAGSATVSAGSTSTTVSVTTIEDVLVEDDETFTVTLAVPQGQTLPGGVSLSETAASATGTITDDDTVTVSVAAWLARFGRTAASQVLEAVESRLDAARQVETQVTLASERIGAGDGEAERLADWLRGGPDAERERAVSPRELLTGSSFAMTAASAGGGYASLWGRGAAARFEGREGDLTLDGEVASGLLGAEWSRERWSAGLIVSHSAAEGGYRGGEDADGAVEATLTGLHPWGRLALGERVEAWGAAGRGRGKLTVTPGGDGPALRTDLDLSMAAVGLRGALLDGGGEGVTLTGKTDAMVVRTASDAVRTPQANLAAARVTVRRLRLGLEGRYDHTLEGGGTLTPRLEVGVRHDDGEAETGAGLEIGGGLAWTNPARGLTAELSGRALIAHAEDGYREWGAGGSLSLAPGAGGRGLSFRLVPSWGTAEGGAQRLWANDTGVLANFAAGDGAANDNTPAMQLGTELGYGLGAFGGQGTLTPYVGSSLAGEGARDFRLGARLQLAPSLDLTLEGTRHQSDSAGPDHGIGFTLHARF